MTNFVSFKFYVVGWVAFLRPNLFINTWLQNAYNCRLKIGFCITENCKSLMHKSKSLSTTDFSKDP